MKSFHRSARLAATVLACCVPIMAQAQESPSTGAAQAGSQARLDALAPVVARTLQKTVNRAARQMRIMGPVLQRMSGVDGALDVALRDEFFAAYISTLRTEPALRISAQRPQPARLAPETTDVLLQAAAAYADLCADLRTLHGVVLANGDHRTITAAANAKAEGVAIVLQQAARNLAAVTDRSDT